jgi:hypothetical protein
MQRALPCTLAAGPLKDPSDRALGRGGAPGVRAPSIAPARSRATPLRPPTPRPAPSRTAEAHPPPTECGCRLRATPPPPLPLPPPPPMSAQHAPPAPLPPVQPPPAPPPAPAPTPQPGPPQVTAAARLRCARASARRWVSAARFSSSATRAAARSCSRAST